MRVAKKNPGQDFENLDMLSLLLGIPTTVVTHDKSEIEDLTHIKASEAEEDDENDEERIYSKLIFNKQFSQQNTAGPSIQLVEEPQSLGGIGSESAISLETDTSLLQSSNAMETGNAEEDVYIEDADEEDIDWSHQQTLPRPYTETPTFSISYGFMDLYQGFFDVDRLDAIDLEDPDGVPTESRRKMRLLSENADFNVDHYIADFMDTEIIETVKAYHPQWSAEYETLVRLETNPNLRPTETVDGIAVSSMMRNDEIAVTWTDAHRDVLIRLPKRQYPDTNEREAMLGLVDLMFAYAYNLRTMEGENTVESAWTIVKLSSVLSWFDKMETLQETLLSSARRALIYPLYRNWSLVNAVFQDVYQLFCLGKRAVLRALIEIKQLCDVSETKHILSRLYLDDYCVWIQKVPRKRFAALATQILDMTERITKEDTGLPLAELEALAHEDAVSHEQGADDVEFHQI